jgi:hypothetical protein
MASPFKAPYASLPPTKVITFRLDEELYREVKALADKVGVSMNRLLTDTMYDAVIADANNRESIKTPRKSKGGPSSRDIAWKRGGLSPGVRGFWEM